MKQSSLHHHPPRRVAPCVRAQPRRVATGRCRGGVYLAVLGASMIVSVLGVAGLYAVGLQAKISVSANNAARAAVAAQSGTEYARLMMRVTPTWRSDITNNTWTGDVPFDGGALAFKVVDELDGNLSNNATDPVRLYAKASFGKAVRLISVQLAPDGTGRMLPVAGTWRQEVMP